MKISQEYPILIYNLYLSKQYDTRRMLSEFPDNFWKVGSIDSLLKRFRKTRTIVQQPGSARPCIRRVAVDDLVFSQEGKPKTHRSAREILHETAFLRSTVHRIIHRDLQLKCFIRRRAQVLCEANRIIHLIR